MTLPPARKVTRWHIAIFGVAVFFYWVALYLYVPTLPIYVKQFSQNLGTVGLVLSMYGLWQALVRFPVGLAADWLGRSLPFLLLGFGFTALGPWLMGLAPNIGWIGVGRAITGLAAATWVPIVVVFCRFFPPTDTIRAAAILTMLGAVGRILATGVTGYLNALGGYTLAFSLAALMALLSLVLILLVPETPRLPHRPEWRPIAELASRPHVLYPALLNAMAQIVNFALTFGFMPILAADLGANDVEVSFLITLNMILTFLGNGATALLAHRLSARMLIRFEFLVLGVGALLAAWAPQLIWLYLAQACIGLATGIGYPTLLGLSIRDVSDRQRTAAMGLHQSVYGFGMFGGPFIAGFLADWVGLSLTFALLAGICLVVLVPRGPGRILLVATAPGRRT